MRTRKLWQAHEIKYLFDFYPNLQTKLIADHLKRTMCSVNGMAHKLEIKKSKAFFESDQSGRLTGSTGHSHRYPKGHVPANKGKKMTKEWKDKVKSTWFGKGHLPHNTLSDGHISQRKDKRGIEQLFIRVSLGNWVHLSRYNYQYAHGDLPAGMIVAFRDRNTLNCDASNLMLLTRKENMIRNSIQRYPSEVKQAIRAISKLNKAIKNAKE